MRRQMIAIVVALGLALAPAAAASADTQIKLALPDVTVTPDGTAYSTFIALRTPDASPRSPS
jgi:hypothetical protein